VLDVCFAKQQNTSELDTVTTLNEAYRAKKRAIVERTKLLETEQNEKRDKKEQFLSETIEYYSDYYSEKKAEYIGMIEYQIYENFKETEENKEMKSIDQVFVTFNSVDGAKRALHTFTDAQALAEEEKLLPNEVKDLQEYKTAMCPKLETC
jgi:hypothetical protein